LSYIFSKFSILQSTVRENYGSFSTFNENDDDDEEEEDEENNERERGKKGESKMEESKRESVREQEHEQGKEKFEPVTIAKSTIQHFYDLGVLYLFNYSAGSSLWM
jgi:hypothetical protein